jgi:hypothetical protein
MQRPFRRLLAYLAELCPFLIALILLVMLWVFLVCLLGDQAMAQSSGYTQVTATITDPHGTVYQNCRGSAQFANESTLSQQPLLGGSTFQLSVPVSGCDAFGHLSMRLADNNVVQPTPSQWLFQICDQTDKYCFSAYITITGSSQDISATLSAAAAVLPVTGSGGITSVGTAPSGSCVAGAIEQLTPNGLLYTCQSGTWGLLTGSGGLPGSLTGIVYAAAGVPSSATSTQLQTAIGVGVYDTSGAAAGVQTNLNTEVNRAETAESGLVSLSGSYTNPNWLSTLAWSKLTGVFQNTAVNTHCVQFYVNGTTIQLQDAGAICGTGGSGANANGSYWVAGSANAPANAINLGGLSSGLLKITVSSGVATPAVAVAGTDFQAPLTNPVTGPGSGATVGHLAVMGNTAGTSITDGGAVPTLSSLGAAAANASTSVDGQTCALGSSCSHTLAAFGAGALANGSTATTQTAGDSSTDVATDAFVANGLAGKQSTLTNPVTASVSGVTVTDPGTTANVPMVSNGSHGMQPSASGALGTGAFAPAYSLPAATSSTLGGVKPDGTTITNSSGAISCTPATSSQLGCVKPDGTTVTVSSGVISAAGAGQPATVYTTCPSSLPATSATVVLNTGSTACTGTTTVPSSAPTGYTVNVINGSSVTQQINPASGTTVTQYSGLGTTSGAITIYAGDNVTITAVNSTTYVAQFGSLNPYMVFNEINLQGSVAQANARANIGAQATLTNPVTGPASAPASNDPACFNGTSNTSIKDCGYTVNSAAKDGNISSDGSGNETVGSLTAGTTVTAKALYGPASPFTSDQACSSGNYWIAPIAGTTNAWRMCSNGTLSTIGGSITAAAMVTALNGQTGCTTAGYVWDVADDKCIASGGAPAGSGVVTDSSGTLGVVDTGTTANIALVSTTGHSVAPASGTVTTGGTNNGVLVPNGLFTVGTLSNFTTTNGYAVSVGSMVWVSDPAYCGDVTTGSGTAMKELLECKTVSSGACTAWQAYCTPYPPTAIASLPTCASALEGQHFVATTCNASCSAGGTCTTGGSTHCELYCNGSSYYETGR